MVLAGCVSGALGRVAAGRHVDRSGRNGGARAGRLLQMMRVAFQSRVRLLVRERGARCPAGQVIYRSSSGSMAKFVAI
jgi:hypothetical protein